MGFFNIKPSSAPWIGLPRCGQCGLSKTCTSPKMEPTGKGRHKILFVAEAPGEQEDRQGVQLIGDAGKCLRKMLRTIGLDLDDCWKTNAAICRPPKNEIEDLHIESCRPNLLKTIAELKPRVIILLGLSAVKSLIPTEWQGDIGGAGRWIGWTIPSVTYGAWICPTYHPSYLVRQKEDPMLMRMVTEHLEYAVALEGVEPRGLASDALSKQIEVVVDIREGRKRMRKLAQRTGVLAFDYETTGLKPERKEQEIYTCSFCLDGDETFACRIDESSHEALSAVLQNPDLQKVASNLKFEERWTRVKLGHPVAAWHWDTMLTAHVLDNRSDITSVKFQSYIHFGVGDYSSTISPFLKAPTPNGLNQIKQAPLEDLLRYNAMDSLMEYKVMRYQQEIFDGH